MIGLADKLDKFRQSLPGCRLAAYGDLMSELVLLSAGDERRPREHLDEISAEAARLFQAADRVDHPGCIADLPRFGLTVILPGELRLYLRGNDSDFLCLVSDTAANCTASGGPGNQFLSYISGAQDV